MQGKTVVITGGTSGIGEIAAQRLAQMGARIVLIARSKARGRVALARLNERSRGLGHTVHYADLTRISEMKRVAAEIASQERRIDVLINNAGAIFASRRLQGTGVTANCLHPGFVATRIGDESDGLISRFAWLAKLIAKARKRSSISPPRLPSRKRRGNISTSVNPSHLRQWRKTAEWRLYSGSAALTWQG